jgi:hypothetical protein
VLCAEPQAVRALLLEREHMRERATVHRLLAMLPGLRRALSRRRRVARAIQGDAARLSASCDLDAR